MKKVFLSHSSQDKNFVRLFASKLAEENIPYWLDESEILVGESLIEKIGSGIYETDCIIAFISSSSVKSNWVRKELQLAMTREIEENQLRVIPIIIDDCEIPTYLRDKLYADLRDEKRLQNEFMRVVRSISNNSRIGVSNDNFGSKVVLSPQQLNIEKRFTRKIIGVLIGLPIPITLLGFLTLIPIIQIQLGAAIAAILFASGSLFLLIAYISYKLSFKNDKTLLNEFSSEWSKKKYYFPFTGSHRSIYLRYKHNDHFARASKYELIGQIAMILLAVALFFVVPYLFENFDSWMTTEAKEQSKEKFAPILYWLFG